MKFYSSRQFAIWRMIFGIYLVVYFITLLPYSTELFSSKGAVPHSENNWRSSGLFPNILNHYDAPPFIEIFILFMAILSIFLAFGPFRPIVSILLWYGWACMLNRNNLIEDPVTHFVGWFLLICAVVPQGESFSLSKSKKNWNMPRILYYGAWIILGAGYAVSGITKLHSPSWINGSAMGFVYSGTFTFNNHITKFMLALPIILLKFQTWFSLALEILALPLFIWKRTRFWAWLLLVFMHLVILLSLNIPHVTIGMLIFHLFVFDRRWLDKYFEYNHIKSLIQRLRRKTITS